MRPIILTLSAAFLIFTLSALPATALAATIHVPGEQPTIQAGIVTAVDGDLVLVAPGTYVENINFLGKAIILRSEAGAGGTIIDAHQSGSGVRLASGEPEEAVVDGFTITNGNSGGVYCSSSVTIMNCIISRNSFSPAGGGIRCYYASPTIKNCMITENSSFEGGGIRCEGESSPVIMGCTITGNSAEEGGGGI